eukprot:CAMPEP_0181194426 /NCGR_PEP_ID=MMETSP1096-20121128/14334_1 /TAXON_ID=156174 ORGANISM="Chrysochromulina ericina, Strain CCMP281" /NCGR_SAMPLE_ID=MMETSP1096 /ASSEMBLY_ACC=CAM_ASM_000453 /LENGTH=109 /DNA_ID=CAMNT_0023283935 /DNA_START=257 /DNA_END=586 /DNA_ORIENTATION=-
MAGRRRAAVRIFNDGRRTGNGGHQYAVAAAERTAYSAATYVRATRQCQHQDQCQSQSRGTTGVLKGEESEFVGEQKPESGDGRRTVSRHVERSRVAIGTACTNVLKRGL